MKRKQNLEGLALKRYETWHSYHVPGRGNFTTRPKNAVFISPSNTLLHETKKLEVCYELRKEKKQFITEAVPNKEPDRRVDIVCLDDDYKIEVEVTGKPKPDADITYLFNKKTNEWEVIYK